jgi:hypothetical protein
MVAAGCLGFSIECGTFVKGAGAPLMGAVLFIGSVYFLLSAVFGRWMGYLVTMTALSGWLIIHSALWLFGFWSQGLETPTNLGPRGSEPAWVVLAGGLDAQSDRFPTFKQYPGGPWSKPPDTSNEQVSAEIQATGGAATDFLTAQANAELGLRSTDPTAVQTTQFIVDDVRFATDGKTPLAVVTAHFSSGGPQITLTLYHDSGSVPRYSIMFLGGSIILFLLHLPLLDRAERKRKAFLTGGAAPAWYGPA